MNTSNIGDRIRLLRKQKHMTQDELAGKLDASRVQVNQWESGTRELSNARIIKLADYFNVSCDYLLTGKERITTDNSTAVTSAEESIVDNELSFKQYLSQSAIDALHSINELPDDKKEIYQLVVNGILGSKAFWSVIIPSTVRAIEIKNDKYNSGTIPDGLKHKFDQCAQILDLANKAGFSDKTVISDEDAADYELFEAKKLFSDLLQSLINYYSASDKTNMPEILKAYESKTSEKKEIDDFIHFLNKFEIEF